jgi:hypothetical protein
LTTNYIFANLTAKEEKGFFRIKQNKGKTEKMNKNQSISITVNEMVNALAEKDLDFMKKFFRRLFRMSVMRQIAKEIMAEIETPQGHKG